MLLVINIVSISFRGRRPRLTRGSGLFCQAALLGIVCAVPAWATPVILNVPLTMMSGNVVGVEGSGFGSSPKVYFGTQSSPPAAVKIIRADNNFVSFEVPKNLKFGVYYVAISDGTTTSKVAYTNLPRGMQFDTPEIASNDSFRIFGRNLYVANTAALPTVTLADTATGAQLAATVNLSLSDPYCLSVTAPSGILAGHTYKAIIYNGSISEPSDTGILGRSATGTDYYNLQMPWGRDYIYQNGPNYNGTVDNSDHHVYNVTSDPFLTVHAAGDGVTDDQAAIQAAINQASWHGGGLVYLPAGTYKLGSASGSALNMYSNVVLQGHSSADTTILLGPSTQQPASYVFWGISWPAGATTSGVADLTITNVDTLSQVVNIVQSAGSTSKLFFARVNFNLGTGLFLNIYNSDRLVFENSNVTQAINNQQPNRGISRGKRGRGSLVWQFNEFYLPE